MREQDVRQIVAADSAGQMLTWRVDDMSLRGIVSRVVQSCSHVNVRSSGSLPQWILVVVRLRPWMRPWSIVVVADSQLIVPLTPNIVLIPYESQLRLLLKTIAILICKYPVFKVTRALLIPAEIDPTAMHGLLQQVDMQLQRAETP